MATYTNEIGGKLTVFSSAIQMDQHNMKTMIRIATIDSVNWDGDSKKLNIIVNGQDRQFGKYPDSEVQEHIQKNIRDPNMDALYERLIGIENDMESIVDTFQKFTMRISRLESEIKVVPTRTIVQDE